MASTMARAYASGLEAIEDPGSDEHPIDAERHHQGGVCGEWAMRGAAKFTTGSLPEDMTSRTSSKGAPWSLAAADELPFVELGQRPHLVGDRPHVANRLHDVPGAGFSLRADHGGAFSNPTQRLTKVRVPHTKGVVNAHLLRGAPRRGSEHFGFIDETTPRAWSTAASASGRSGIWPSPGC